MIISDLHKALRTLLEQIIQTVSGASTSKLIWNLEGGPRPPLPYFMLADIGDGVKHGLPDRDAKVVSGIQSSSWDEDATFDLTGYGKASKVILESLGQKLETASVEGLFDAANLVIRNASRVKEVSVTLSEQPEKRYLIELTIGYRVSVDDQPGTIEKINGSLNAYDLQETILPPA